MTIPLAKRGAGVQSAIVLKFSDTRTKCCAGSVGSG